VSAIWPIQPNDNTLLPTLQTLTAKMPGQTLAANPEEPVTSLNPPRPGEARWVVYEYCISFIVITLRRTSRPYLLRPGQRAWVRGLPYCAISLVFGWWGLPWGVWCTMITIVTNLAGGREAPIVAPQEKKLERDPGGESCERVGWSQR
jgi:hypothetical protein